MDNAADTVDRHRVLRTGGVGTGNTSAGPDTSERAGAHSAAVRSLGSQPSQGTAAGTGAATGDRDVVAEPEQAIRSDRY